MIIVFAKDFSYIRIIVIRYFLDLICIEAFNKNIRIHINTRIIITCYSVINIVINEIIYN